MLALASMILAVTFLTSIRHAPEAFRHPSIALEQSPSLQTPSSLFTSSGKAIAPKLANETAKAELGRAAWRVLHTTFARFPEKPTKEESAALESYVYLFQRLYPCGECAAHFGELLKKYPPQVSSRNVAAGWGCHIHNEVNKSLKKPLFDCTKIGDFYDCGCGDDEKSSEDLRHAEAESAAPEGRTGKEEVDEDLIDASLVRLEREEYQRGG
ncbi:MAG: hypothetical protein M1828_000014 [Chrysothrix sp. TS-e1954]|nr:MAG: hypothetical protein M1828_000014 [Chrysothrix sp. TS-e1954]